MRTLNLLEGSNYSDAHSIYCMYSTEYEIIKQYSLWILEKEVGSARLGGSLKADMAGDLPGSPQRITYNVHWSVLIKNVWCIRTPWISDIFRKLGICAGVLPWWCEERTIDRAKAGQPHKHWDDPSHHTQVPVAKILQDVKTVSPASQHHLHMTITLIILICGIDCNTFNKGTQHSTQRAKNESVLCFILFIWHQEDKTSLLLFLYSVYSCIDSS